MRHLSLFLATALTATHAGILLAITEADALEPAIAPPVTWLDYLLFIPFYYAQVTNAVVAHALAYPPLIVQGVIFAVALLAILLAHEAGHYVACRRYGVAATLPFFIPAPPLFLAGTFGAFIKIKSPIPSRRALFDIAIAGPLAGFAVIVPVAIAGVLTAHPPATPLPSEGLIIFNDPPLLRLLAGAFGVDLLKIAPNPFYFAAWIGLLVTSLNLLPVGQLDGGHAAYAVFGARTHKWLGRSAFVTILVLAPLGWVWHGTLSGLVYALLLFIMLRVRHPQATDETDLLAHVRIRLAIATLIVFLLSFTPFPITII